VSDGELVLSIAVMGKPEPQGSASAWVPTDKAGNPYRRKPDRRNPRGAIIVNVTTDNKALKSWREAVEIVARGEMLRHEGGEPVPFVDVGFTIEMLSFLQRPKKDWGTGRNARLLKDHAPAFPLTIPDADKLLRGVMDALTGVVWKDDSQVTDAITRKRYAVPTADGDAVRAEIRVWRNAVQAAGDLPLEQRERVVPTADTPDDALTLL
jgi:Holliday junction resolvase RusA-like endonuclease